MSNDDYHWLQSYMSSDPYQSPLRYGDAPMPSFPGFTSSQYQEPPPAPGPSLQYDSLYASQPRPQYQPSASASFESHPPPPQQFAQPFSQPPPRSSLQSHQAPSNPYSQPPAPPSVQPQSYVTPSNLMMRQTSSTSSPAPHAHPAPPSSSMPPRPAQPPAGQASNPILLDSNTGPTPLSRAPTHDSHDAKRRRINEPNTSTPSSAPGAPPRPYNPPNYMNSVLGGTPNSQKLSSYNYTPRDPTNKTGIKHRADIAQLMNPADAAKKLTYDPKTIARDVLIAAGRHPTDKSLNHHLIHLRDVFPRLELSADLDTFRWDLVEQAAKRVTSARDPVQTSAPPASNFGVVPPAAPVNKPTAQQTQPPRPPQPSQPLPPISAQEQRERISWLAQIQNQFTSTPPPPPPQSSQSSQPPRRTPQKTPQPPPSKLQTPPKPQSTPQSQNKPPSHSPAKSLTPTVQIPSVKMPGKRGRPSGRPPGRPPGSTNKVKKVQQLQVAVPAPKVNYQVYACRWDSCQAKMHNLDMLKKHVYKNHVTYSITCSWKNCDSKQTMPAAELYKHVKKQHIDPIAWKLGDGPSVPGTGDSSTTVSPGPFAPPASNQPQGEDSLIFPASLSSIRAFNRVHGNTTQYEKAREILKAMQRLKDQIGVGLDPGGCQLATPARNKRVSNEEDYYEVDKEYL